MARDNRRRDMADRPASEPASEGGPAIAAFDVERKVEAVMASKMPEAQKERYVRNLRGAAPDPNSADRMPFDVYANIKGIKQSVRVGMLAYPKAKGVKAATVAEWDEIFQGF